MKRPFREEKIQFVLKASACGISIFSSWLTIWVHGKESYKPGGDMLQITNKLGIQ